MLKHIPQFTLSFVLSIVFSISHASSMQNQDTKNIDNDWLKTVLKLQREIDLNVPLKEATFLGTHNSYNSESYQNAMGSYIDPNQKLTIYDQLESGIRSIEFDGHWTLGDAFSKEILSCHGRPNHLGCYPFDRPFSLGLIELRNWLAVNPNEIVLLYLELYLDGNEPKLAEQLDHYLGNFIYKPAILNKDNKDNINHTCLSLPTYITKTDILNAGKQLIIVRKGCDHSKQGPYLNDFVFAGIGDIPGQPKSIIDATITTFIPYPNCNVSSIFSHDLKHDHLWRIYEDRTVLSNIVRYEKKLLAQDMLDLMRCGINFPTMDMLEKNDLRLYAAIWSWSPSYPKGNGQCAIYKFDDGMQNVPCTHAANGFSCQEERSRLFKVIAFKGPWTNGESVCQSIAGKDWHFAAPVNGKQLHAIKESMAQQAIQEISLNYQVNKFGQWRVGSYS